MAVCGPPTSMTTVSSVTESLFQRGSQYQQFRPTYPPALFQWLANQCPCRDRAMDLGCGSGQASRGLELWFRQVIGADISHPQLLAAPPSSSHYLVSVAHRLPLADASLDLITVAQAYHWFDQTAFQAEAERTLRPEGVLALISYGICEVAGLEGMIRDFHDGPLAPWWPAQRAQVVAGYPDASLPWPALTYPGDSITLDWSATDMLGYLDTWSALVQAARAGESLLDDFAPRLKQAWGKTQRTVRWPLRVRAWRKQ